MRDPRESSSALLETAAPGSGLVRRRAAWPLRLSVLGGVALLSLGLAGCASNQPMKVTEGGEAAGLSIGYQAPDRRGAGYYGLLQPEGSGWSLVGLGTEPPQRTRADQEILFVSQDLKLAQPAFVDKAGEHAFNCAAGPQAVPAGVPGLASYSACGSTRFASTMASATVARNILAVLPTVVTAGTSRSLDRPAVEEALRLSGLMPQLRRVAAAREALDRSLAALTQAELALGRRAEAEVRYDYFVADRSGLFGRPDPALDRLVQVSLPNLATSWRDEIGQLSGQTTSADALAAAYAGLAARISSATAALPQTFAVKLQCGATQHGVFALALTCPPQAAWSDIVAGRKVPLVVEVLTATPRRLQPKFLYADDALQVQVEGNGLQLTNRTASFIEVREVSCYVDNEITTRRWTRDGDTLTLPPNGQLKPALSRNEVCGDAALRKLQLQALRVTELKGRALRFGVAVKYRRAGEAVDRTLYQQRDYPLEALVREAI